MNWWKKKQTNSELNDIAKLTIDDIANMLMMSTNPYLQNDPIKHINYDKIVNLIQDKNKKQQQIPIFSYSIRTKILNQMIKISHSDVKPGMVIALSYDRYLQSEQMTDSGIKKNYTSYRDIFVFGVISIEKWGIHGYSLTVETYAPYEESCGNDRKILVEEGIITNLKYSFREDKDKDQYILAKTLYNASDYCDQVGPCTTYINFDIFNIPSPEQYI